MAARSAVGLAASAAEETDGPTDDAVWDRGCGDQRWRLDDVNHESPSQAQAASWRQKKGVEERGTDQQRS